MIHFSIITVTYNSADCIEKTMQSVFMQGYHDIDYIIIDGASKDGTAQIIADYAEGRRGKRFSSRITYWVSEPDKGIYDAMNKGIDIAHRLSEQDGCERFVLMLNADDTLFEPDTLQKVADFIDEHYSSVKEMPDVVAGSWMLHPGHGEYLRNPGNFAELPRNYVVCHQATFIKASVLYHNKFDLKYRFAGDYKQISDLYINGYRFVAAPDIVVSHMMLNVGTTDRNWRHSMHEGYDIMRERGTYRFGEETFMLVRKGGVRLLRTLLPKSVSNALFGWLGRHYKPI